MNSRRLMCGWPRWQEYVACRTEIVTRTGSGSAGPYARMRRTPTNPELMHSGAQPTHRRFASGLWNRINENPARALVQLKGRGLGNAHQLEAKKDRALRPEKHPGAREVPKSVSRTHGPLCLLLTVHPLHLLGK